jgi:RNA polymerase sigma-70 factor (ECF subfamily)
MRVCCPARALFHPGRGNFVGQVPQDQVDVDGSHMGSDRLAVFRGEALRHLPELLRVATRLAAGRGEAEDLVQETFLQAWRSFDNFAPGTNCRAWLYRILFLVSRSRGRKAGRVHLVALEEAPEAALADEPPLPDVIGREHVRAAFESLSEEHRLVLQLADVEGLRYREVAEALGIPIGTVMSRLSRAREALRRRLSEGERVGPVARRGTA